MTARDPVAESAVTPPVTSPVDWTTAVAVGRRRAPRGPQVTAAEAAAAVAELRQLSAAAEARVRETTGLGAALPMADALVVDRRGWVTAAAEGMEILSAPLGAALADSLRQAPTAAAQRVAGQQVGFLLGYLSGKVLGQYDPVGGGGRLLLVAPNIMKVERALAADPTDFRLWVCLHESTHRLQFTAADWMPEHFVSLVGDYGALAPVEASEMLPRIWGAVVDRAGGEPGESWLQRIQTDEQRPVFDSLLALMTLLEGHADFVMDAVGPQVVPSVASIRAAFTERRRRGTGLADRIMRVLLGMDVKIAQYERGAAFVSAVVARIGMERFNAVFAGPEQLPTLAEIAAPDTWIARVYG